MRTIIYDGYHILAGDGKNCNTSTSSLSLPNNPVAATSGVTTQAPATTPSLGLGALAGGMKLGTLLPTSGTSLTNSANANNIEMVGNQTAQGNKLVMQGILI